MDSLFLLVPIALVFCFIAIKLLLWAIGSGQYDDLDKEAYRVLMEDPQESVQESAQDSVENSAEGSPPEKPDE
jgi:cbb3-type cytochrome oxidase maturation protein